MAQDAPSSSVTAHAVGLTDVGRVREHNEDSFLLVDPRSGTPLGNSESIRCEIGAAMILAVADGMGGAAAGEVASRMAVERFAAALSEVDFGSSSPDQIENRIEQALQTANSEIKQDATDNPERRGMGTTFTAVVATPGRMFIAQIGDSRCYLLRKDTLVRMTRDQSLREQLIEDGTLTEEEAENFGGGNIILQALGVEDSVRPDTKQHELLRGDLLLICSDGLSGMVKDADMETIVRDCGDDLEGGVQKLIDAANEGGGKDNITAILARFEGERLRAPLGPVTDLEKAGHSWKAPEAPDVPNPMKKVLIGLGVIIALILVAYLLSIRTTSNLRVAVKPIDLAVEGALLDAEGNEVARREAADGVIEFSDVEGGDYRIVLTAAEHFEKELTIHVEEAGEIDTEEQWLRPRGGTVTVSSVLPHIRVVVESQGTGHPDENLEPLENQFEHNVQTPLSFENVAPGRVTIRASREGYRPFEGEAQMEPGGELSFGVEGMEAVTGTLVIVTDVAGLRVVVTDRYGHEVTTEVVPEGETELSVRAGSDHTLTATYLGRETLERPLEIREGESTRLELNPDFVPIQVVIASASSADYTRGEILSVDDTGNRSEVSKISIVGGQSNPKSLPPGSYVVKLNTGVERAFVVRPGQGNLRVDADQ